MGASLSPRLCQRAAWLTPTQLRCLYCEFFFVPLLFIFLTAFLRSNSRAIQLTHLKCAIRWLFVDSRNCATIIARFLEHFHDPLKKSLCPLAGTPLPSASTAPRNNCVYLVTRCFFFFFFFYPLDKNGLCFPVYWLPKISKGNVRPRL